MQCGTEDDGDDILYLDKMQGFPIESTKCADLGFAWNVEHLSSKCVETMFYIYTDNCYIKSSIGKVFVDSNVDRIMLVEQRI